jgi:AraC-like DNA-binding protein
VVACTWEQRVGAGGGHAQRVLPDGHADLVVDHRGRAVLVGPATGVSVTVLPPGEVMHGLRLAFPAVGSVLGVPAGELTDRVVPLSALLGESRARMVADALGGGDRGAWVRVHHWLAAAQPDPRAAVAAARLWHRPDAEVAAVARRVGLSDRQLRRLLHAEVGLGPRTFQRIGRLQRFLMVATAHPGRGLAELAADAGFADQPHLSREARSLTGLTAAGLVAFQLG